MKNFNEAKIRPRKAKIPDGKKTKIERLKFLNEQSSIIITNRKQSKFGQCNNTYKFGMTNKYKRKEENF